ncbi:SgcJ/EcaC family oxidoreductase [Virgibacillus ihumii]|uniref:SgcJ/EcaC family oxidoreductase n=1 Tax=Virgibacillus ihumii TaxID=2686091 RepID=UPI00157C49A5|nr:SgcJ/EcaC family oxidoreductase [Virgibacillus ihumii]
MNGSIQDDIIELYNNLISAWNNRDAEGMADKFSDEGVQIGFDGSKLIGKQDILAHLAPIFESHPTAPFVTKIKGVRKLGTDTALLHAIAGMVPPGKSDIEPSVNAHQTLIAVKSGSEWRVELFQNTPAQFHGRPELVEEMTEELRKVYFDK